MSANELETPEQMAERLWSLRGGLSIERRAVAKGGMIADRKQIAAWCEQKAAEAQREADAHEAQIEGTRSFNEMYAKRERRERCEGQASAFRAVAAMLRSK